MFSWLKKHFTPLIRWREPADYVSALNLERAKDLDWKTSLILVFIPFPLMLPFWWLAHYIPSRTPPPFWAACITILFLGVFLVFGIPWMKSFCPREVTLHRKSLLLAQGNMTRFIAIKEIKEVVFIKIDQRMFAQVFRQNSPKRVLAMQLCIPDAETSEGFIKHLTDLNVTIRLDTPTVPDTRG